MSDNDEKAKRSAQLLAISSIMSNAGGREFMHGQLMQSFVFVSVFDSDPITHAFNAWVRESGLRLQRELKVAAPDQYWLMMKENDDG